MPGFARHFLPFSLLNSTSSSFSSIIFPIFQASYTKFLFFVSSVKRISQLRFEFDSSTIRHAATLRHATRTIRAFMSRLSNSTAANQRAMRGDYDVIQCTTLACCAPYGRFRSNGLSADSTVRELSADCPLGPVRQM